MSMSIAETYAALTAPGAPFEMEERDIFGMRTRVWKNAPPNLRAILEQSRVHGDLPFLVYEDERMTYAGHLQAVARMACALTGRFGIRKGDRIAIAMRNFPEWSIAFWATTAVGAISVPLNAWMTGPELEYCLSDSGSVLLITDAERAERLAPHLAALDLRATIVARGGKPLAAGMLDFGDVLNDAPVDATLPDVAIDPEDDATIFYTSGTTGKPKGALGTHRNICTNLLSLAFSAARAKLRRGEKLPGPDEPQPKKSYLLSVPFFHVTGCHSVLAASLFAGNKLVLMRRWNPERAMQLIERERINGFGGVPSMAWQVIESPDFGRYDLSSVESVGYGGAPAAAELVARIGGRMPAAQASNGYGMTETSSVTTQNVGEDYQRKPDSAGLAVPICDLRVVDASGRDVEPGGNGELWVKGANIVKGYWNNPEATAQSFTDGWLHTGDVVRIDDEGFLYILDRAKDMLIRGGENIYCVEVEDALYSHPAVMDAAVIGIPHRVLGEEVAAVVQLKPGMSVSEDELKRHAATRIAAFKVPVRIALCQEPLPRNPNGKILKRDLKSAFD
ncbi:MAG TPA: class I adenylate-forming enzyme family protein [Candidatus Cybelea sp.]|nr:class I adenylate-forming enzyme family protein [Candidatus Cybelea sp.]